MARRITIDLTDAAEAEIERLRKAAGLTTADLFRLALSVYRNHDRCLDEISRFAKAFHGDQPPHLLLHGLTVDIPAMCETYKAKR